MPFDNNSEPTDLNAWYVYCYDYNQYTANMYHPASVSLTSISPHYGHTTTNTLAVHYVNTLGGN